MTDASDLLRWSGVAGSLVGFAAVLSAAALSPTFSWTADAISSLGAAGAANPWILNAGLVAAGLVSLPFARVLWTTARHLLERAGAVAFGLGVVALVGVGVFPAGTDLHGPAAVSYFVLLTFVAWLHGSGAVLAGDAVRGLVAVWLGIAHVLAWVVWGLGVRPGPGIAIPEFVGSLLFLAWLVLVTRGLDAVDAPAADGSPAAD